VTVFIAEGQWRVKCARRNVYDNFDVDSPADDELQKIKFLACDWQGWRYFKTSSTHPMQPTVLEITRQPSFTPHVD